MENHSTSKGLHMRQQRLRDLRRQLRNINRCIRDLEILKRQAELRSESKAKGRLLIFPSPAREHSAPHGGAQDQEVREK